MKWRIVLAVGITVVCLAFVLWGLPVAASIAALGRFQWWAAIVVSVVYAGVLVLRAWRLQVLLDRHVPLMAMIVLNAAGFLAINVVPLRMGELVRPYLLREKHGIPFGSAVAAIVLERLLDLFALMITLFLVAALVTVPGELTVGGVDLLLAGRRTVGTLVGVGLVGVLVVGIIGSPAVEVVAKVGDRIRPAIGSRIRGLGEPFVAGLRTAAKRPVAAVIAVGCTVGMWLAAYVAVWVTMFAFPDVRPTIPDAVFNWTATITAMTLFPTPAFLGGFEMGSAGSMRLLGYSQEVATPFALVVHAEMFGFTVVSGIWALLREGWSLTGVVKASRSSS